MSEIQEPIPESKPDPGSAGLKHHIARLQIAYLSIIETHANLMLTTLSPDQIRDNLDLAYSFNLPEDVVADLRAALNAEQQHRTRIKELTQ